MVQFEWQKMKCWENKTKKSTPLSRFVWTGVWKKKGGRGGNGDLDLDLDFFYGLWILYFSVCVCVLIKLDFLIFFLKKSEFLCMDMNMSTGYKSLCVRDIYRRTYIDRESDVGRVIVFFLSKAQSAIKQAACRTDRYIWRAGLNST